MASKMASDDKTYVVDSTEVKLTGRTARKPGVSGSTLELIEITPVDEDQGTWKKWVPRQSLFVIDEA